jgi:type II secretory pathway predicted ATPase ExeA
VAVAKEYSPFTPGVPVPIEFFVGREREVTDIVTRVRKSLAQKSLERIFIVGERGIGKSSLCRYALRIAEDKDDVLGLHVFLGGVATLEEMIRRIFERLLQESQDRNWFDSVKSFLGNHVREVGLFGIKLEFEAPQHDLRQAVNNFAPTLRNLLKSLSGQRKGLMIVLDDLNGLAGSAEFANWLKSLVDEIATAREPLPLTLVLVGLPDRRRQLIEKQQSLDRVFDLVEIRRFNADETRQFYQQAFDKVHVAVDDAAHKVLWQYSGGYPAFLHEIGDAAFKVDTDNQISFVDAIVGVLSAVEIIGKKYIEPRVLDAIWSTRYRSIMKKFADRDSRFSKADLAGRCSSQEAKVLNNFLQKMKQLGVIRQDPALGQGPYEFTSELYLLFFCLQAAKEKKDDNRV